MSGAAKMIDNLQVVAFLSVAVDIYWGVEGRQHSCRFRVRVVRKWVRERFNSR